MGPEHVPVESFPAWANLVLLIVALFTKELVGLVRELALRKKGSKPGAAADRAAAVAFACGAADVATILKETASEQRHSAEALRGVMAILERHDREERQFQRETGIELARIHAAVEVGNRSQRGA